MKRIWCFIFHWRRQQVEPSYFWYQWKCGICGERWRTPRTPQDSGRNIILANDDFLRGMPDDWEGDLLQDAVDSGWFLLHQFGIDVSGAGGSDK